MWPLWGRLRQRLHAQPIEEYHHQLDKKKIRCTSSDSKANFHSCRLLIWPFWWARKHKYTLASSMVDDRVPLDLDGRLWPKKKNELTLTRDDRLQHIHYTRSMASTILSVCKLRNFISCWCEDWFGFFFIVHLNFHRSSNHRNERKKTQTRALSWFSAEFCDADTGIAIHSKSDIVSIEWWSLIRSTLIWSFQSSIFRPQSSIWISNSIV